MFTDEYHDIGDLQHDLTSRLVYGKPVVVNATDTQLHDILVTADHCVYPQFDLKKTWLTEARWNALVSQYLDPNALNTWLDLIEEKLDGPRRRGVAFMRTNSVKSQINATTGREWRRWGSCLLGFSYRARPKPHLSLHSRTTYLGYIAQIDLALAAILARYIGDLFGHGPEDISFTWHLEAGQFHAFKSLAWFFQDEYDQEQLLKAKLGDLLKKQMPTLYLARRTLAQFEQQDEDGKGYGDHNFNQMLRIRRRYHAEVTGTGKQFHHGTSGSTSKRNHSPFPVLPSVPLDALDLESVLARSTGVESINSGMLEEDE